MSAHVTAQSTDSQKSQRVLVSLLLATIKAKEHMQQKKNKSKQTWANNEIIAELTNIVVLLFQYFSYVSY